MSLNELAPWIAIAITLGLSILVPFFTQIANNRFQLKLEKQKSEREIAQLVENRKREAFEDFIESVGGCLGSPADNKMQDAIASINRLYIYTPEEWWPQMDSLVNALRSYEWDKANLLLRELSKKIAKTMGQ